MLKQQYRIRVSPTLTCVVGPCTSADLLETLKAWGYVERHFDDFVFTVDVSSIIFRTRFAAFAPRPPCRYPGCNDTALQYSASAEGSKYYTGCTRHYALLGAQVSE